MPTRRIGSLEVSAVGLGCNNLGQRVDDANGARVVGAAIDAGITFFDTADFYGGTRSEEVLGRALGRRRDDVVVATKFGYPIDDDRRGASPAYVPRALDASLRRLGTDHVDLYQLHRPDPDTPIADTLAALDEQVRAGKVREIGCSNFSARQLEEARAAVRDGAAGFVSVQNEYSLLQRQAEREVLPECRRTGTAFIPFYPLAAGVLSGKYRAGEPPPQGTRLAGMQPERAAPLLAPDRLSVVEGLRAFAEPRGMALPVLAIAWLLAQPAVAGVIAGASSVEQLRSNVVAATVHLSDDDLRQIDTLLDGHAGAGGSSR